MTPCGTIHLLDDREVMSTTLRALPGLDRGAADWMKSQAGRVDIIRTL